MAVVRNNAACVLSEVVDPELAQSAPPSAEVLVVEGYYAYEETLELQKSAAWPRTGMVVQAKAWLFADMNAAIRPVAGAYLPPLDAHAEINSAHIEKAAHADQIRAQDQSLELQRIQFDAATRSRQPLPSYMPQEFLINSIFSGCQFILETRSATGPKITTRICVMTRRIAIFLGQTISQDLNVVQSCEYSNAAGSKTLGASA